MMRLMQEEGSRSDVADLYILPLDQFTAARDEMAQQLKSSGDVDEAKRVSKLRKPSVAAWSLNRASRNNPDEVGRLKDSHRQLRQAGFAGRRSSGHRRCAGGRS